MIPPESELLKVLYSYTFDPIHFELGQHQVLSVHRCWLEVEAHPWVGLDFRFVLVQENQCAEIWTSGAVCEGTLSGDACHPQRSVLPCSDAVEEGLLVLDRLPALGEVFGSVSSKHKPSGVVSDGHGGPLNVTAAVEGGGGEAVDSGLIEQMESDVTKERVQLLPLLLRQAGSDQGHGGADTDNTGPKIISEI